MHETNIFKGDTLFNWFGNLVKISLLLSLMGYLSLTIHLNALGIPSTFWLGNDRYLADLASSVFSILLYASAPFARIATWRICLPAGTNESGASRHLSTRKATRSGGSTTVAGSTTSSTGRNGW